MYESIMIIDDCEEDHYLAKRTLKKSKICEFFFSEYNGEDALQFFRNFDAKKMEFSGKVPPEVILLDVNMPVMNGFEFLKHFKDLAENNPELREVPVVMYSSSNLEEDIKKAKSYSFVKDYWVKSSQPGDLVENFKRLAS